MVSYLSQGAAWRRQRAARPARTAFNWTPYPGPQTHALESEAQVVGYGGAAGGGKTDCQLGVALTHHHNAIIYRREYPQLTGIVDRSRDMIGQAGRYNDSTHRWRFSGGKSLRFGSVPHASNVSRYQGQPHDFVGFDEAQHFLESQVRFLLGWLRPSSSAPAGQRCRCIMTFNPPTTVEGRWVIDFFAPWLDPKYPNPALPGEVRWFAMMDGQEREVDSSEPFEHNGERVIPTSRTFIPARLDDNPALRDTGYRATLQAMPEPLRSQMLYGDFAAGVSDDIWQVIPTDWVKAAMERGKRPRPVGEKGERLPITSLGVDVAAGGADRTVIAPVVGSYFLPLLVYPGTQTPDGNAAAGLVVKALDGASVRPAIDSIGIGQGLVTALNALGIKHDGINVAAGSYARARGSGLGFANLRAEIHWAMREALDPEGGRDIALPDDRELLRELTAARWSLTPSGIQIEPKDDIIERLGRSPDKSDAVLLANYTAPRAGYGANPWRK